MSTLVSNELFAQPGRGDYVASLLLEILGESLQHDGCETIRILRIKTTRVTSPGSRNGPSATTSRTTSRGVRSAASPAPSRPC
jgi:hypothetical protein